MKSHRIHARISSFLISAVELQYRRPLFLNFPFLARRGTWAKKQRHFPNRGNANFRRRWRSFIHQQQRIDFYKVLTWFGSQSLTRFMNHENLDSRLRGKQLPSATKWTDDEANFRMFVQTVSEQKCCERNVLFRNNSFFFTSTFPCELLLFKFYQTSQNWWNCSATCSVEHDFP